MANPPWHSSCSASSSSSAKNAETSDEVIGEPQPYTVDFQVPNGDSDTVDALKGASTLWKDRDKPASGASGLIAKARGDYRRLLATLYSQARYGGTISILIDGREAADLPPDAQLADPASVRVTIDPGPLFHFGRAEIVNQAPPPTDSDDEVDRPERKGFASGELARSGVVLQAERLSVEAWRQQGHAKAEVIERRVEAAHDSDTLDATLVVEPGREGRLRRRPRLRAPIGWIRLSSPTWSICRSARNSIPTT